MTIIPEMYPQEDESTTVEKRVDTQAANWTIDSHDHE